MSPVTCGYRPDGHCGNRGCRPAHHIRNAYGVFCAACCTWISYRGPGW